MFNEIQADQQLLSGTHDYVDIETIGTVNRGEKHISYVRGESSDTIWQGSYVHILTGFKLISSYF